VILRDGIGAARVDTTGNLAVLELKGRIPAQVVGRNRFMAEAQQRFRDHCAITDPRASIGSRSWPDDRTIAADEQLRECGAQRVNERLRSGRNAKAYPL